MTTYDGVPVKIVNRNERDDVELEVTEKMPWESSPDIGDRFWVPGDDKYLKVNSDGD